MKATDITATAQDTAAMLFEMGLRDFPDDAPAGSKASTKLRSKAWRLFMDTLRKPRGKKKGRH